MTDSNPFRDNHGSVFRFEDDLEDIDDNAFLTHPTTGPSGYLLANSKSSYDKTSDDLELRRQQLLERKKDIEQRSVMSTQRSLGYLRNSEEVGFATAEELVRQREQLERTEKKLDDINTTLRFSQKHIQGIKSVFGGLKNLLSGKANEQPPQASSSGPISENATNTPLNDLLDKKVTESRKQTMHPGLQIRGLYDDDDDEPEPSDTQQVIDRNLNDMITSISRLKGLAVGLGEEIDSHNELIENVISKAERADTSLNRQNKSIKRLLE